MSSKMTDPLPPRSYRRIKPTKQPKSWLRTIRNIVLTTILLMVLTAVAFAVHTSINADQVLNQISAPEVVEMPEEEQAKEKPLVILLLGLDERSQIGTMNTDVIMIAALNPERKTATVVSIPRDTYVQAEGWQARKANSFYSILYRSDSETVFDEVKPIYGSFLDIPIDYVSVINFRAFEEIVDALEGIEIEVDQDMHYEDPTDGTYINLKQGLQVLDGDGALDFVRYRHSNYGETRESSDFERNERQQRVVAAVLEKMKSIHGILNINSFLDAIGEHVRTDIPKQQIKSIMETYATISSDNIEYIPIAGTWKSPFVYLDETSFEEAKAALQRQLTLESGDE